MKSTQFVDIYLGLFVTTQTQGILRFLRERLMAAAAAVFDARMGLHYFARHQQPLEGILCMHRHNRTEHGKQQRCENFKKTVKLQVLAEKPGG